MAGKIIQRPELAGGCTVGGVEVINSSGQVVADIKDTLASGKIYVGNASNVSAEVAVTGDITLSNAGVVAVTKVKGATVGTATATSGNILVGDGAKWETVAVSGDVALAANGAMTVTSGFTSTLANVTAANIAGMFGAPVTVVAGQVGKIVEFLGATLIYDYSTDTFAAGGNVSINEESGSAVSTLATAGESFGAAADKIVELKPLAATRVPVTGKGLVITNAAGAFTNPGTAAGVGRLYIRYRVITTGL